MASNNHNDNPWEDQRSEQGQSYQNHNPYQAHQDPPNNPYAQQPPQDTHAQQLPRNPLSQHPPQDSWAQPPPQHQDTSPWGQEPGQAPSHSPYTTSQHQQAFQQPRHQEQPSQPSYPGQDEAPPGLPPRRTATDMILPTGQDRSHQIEVMQSYEAAGRKDEDDANVEVLQREFPKIDGSLIAAIYGDSKSLSATREMLQALE